MTTVVEQSRAVEPFRVEFADADLKDLRARLAQVRWPETGTAPGWAQGVPLDYQRELCEYWANTYDMRRVESQLNAHPQFRTAIDGVDIHFLHVRSSHEDATPILLTHGWPGSVVEFLKVIGPLTDPTAHGGDPADAFHVVIPSLPGYGFSGKPADTGWNIPGIARAWAELMARLGYSRYAAAGCDWGALVSTSIGQQDTEHLEGLHLTAAICSPEAIMVADPTPDEQQDMAGMGHYVTQENGYNLIQSTRPQTLGYGLADSPVLQCAWVVEKFMTWSDCDGHPETVFTRDELLDNVMTYWMTNSGTSSARLYWEAMADVHTVLEPVSAPTGYSVFPKDIYRVSQRVAETRFHDLRYYNRTDRGGHFAAFERPELYIDEVRKAFRAIRSGRS
jgi:pimeloyl-ACP methyl ester carboxylesterase